MNNQHNQQWIPMKDAAKLLNVSRYKLSQLVNAGQIPTRDNIRDKREKLVDIERAKQILGIAT